MRYFWLLQGSLVERDIDKQRDVIASWPPGFITPYRDASYFGAPDFRDKYVIDMKASIFAVPEIVCRSSLLALFLREKRVVSAD